MNGTTKNNRRMVKPIVLPALFLVGFIALWHLVNTFEWVDRLIVPPPADVAVSLYELVVVEGIWVHIWATTWETIAGFAIAAVAGIVLAIVTGLSETLKQMLYPYVIALQVTPRVAIAPILIAWLGFGYSPKIAIAALIAFFPVFLNTLTGMMSVDEEAHEMFQSLGATRRQTFTNLMLPSALPLIFAGLKTAMTLALIGAIVGEFISAQDGLGLLVQRFSYQVNMDDAFAVLIVLTILGLVLYGLTEALDRLLIYWTHDGRLTRRTRRLTHQAQRAVPPPPTDKSNPVPAERRYAAS